MKDISRRLNALKALETEWKVRQILNAQTVQRTERGFEEAMGAQEYDPKVLRAQYREPYERPNVIMKKSLQIVLKHFSEVHNSFVPLNFYVPFSIHSGRPLAAHLHAKHGAVILGHEPVL